MSEHFFDKLAKRVQTSNSLLCIGLDPHVGQLPEATPQAAYDFCLKIVTETHPYAACFKPNCAFFERFGGPGVEALKNLIAAIPKDIPVLLDCKRGDIDTTAQAYAHAAYDALGADSVTLSPYMGWDSVAPFVTGQFANKGAFVLCKTSNNSSNDVQVDMLAGGGFVYEKIVKLCNQWNETPPTHPTHPTHPSTATPAPASPTPCVGLVAGATDLIALRRIRSLSPQIWILCPGVGAQGGEADKVCAEGLRADGSGLLVSVSRGISKAANMGTAARDLRDQITPLREDKIA
ncbi:orotidine-5-phosphate decarboxylase/orotate phosphoribosyltransferase, partial [Ochromonadaceae sp. CCMP2298]